MRQMILQSFEVSSFYVWIFFAKKILLYLFALGGRTIDRKLDWSTSTWLTTKFIFKFLWLMVKISRPI